MGCKSQRQGLLPGRRPVSPSWWRVVSYGAGLAPQEDRQRAAAGVVRVDVDQILVVHHLLMAPGSRAGALRAGACRSGGAGGR